MTTVEKIEEVHKDFVSDPSGYTTEELRSLFRLGKAIMLLAAVEIAEGTE